MTKTDSGHWETREPISSPQGLPIKQEQASRLPHSHAACGKRWSGANTSHCAACHETFTAVGPFVKHRTGGECAQPEAVGLVVNDRGYWGDPGDGTEWWAAAPSEAHLIREWARDRGFHVSAKGRISAEIQEAWREQHGG